MKGKDKKYRLLFARATENANCGSYLTTSCSDLKTLMWASVMSCWLLLASLTTLCRLPDGAHFWDGFDWLLTLYQNWTFCHFLKHTLSRHFIFVIFYCGSPLKILHYIILWLQTLPHPCRIFTIVHFVFFSWCNLFRVNILNANLMWIY